MDASRFQEHLRPSTATATKLVPGSFETHTEAMCLSLDLVFKNGDRLGLPYALMISVALESAGRIAIEYASRLITIEGRNLAPLYNALIVHLARRVIEGDGVDDESLKTWIGSIEVAERD